MPSSRPRTRASVVISGAASLVLAAGCGEDPVLDASNRGAGSHTETTTVENAYIVPVFVPGRCALQLDAGADLRFTVTNVRSADTERLLRLPVDAAEEVQGISNVAIPPHSSVGFGEPSAQPVDAAGAVPSVRLTRLQPGLRPAMTTDVTFHFERAGDIMVPVPVEACPAQAN